MRLRPTDAHVYAFTQHERDTLVFSLRTIIEDEAGEPTANKWVITAGHILDRIKREET